MQFLKGLNHPRILHSLLEAEECNTAGTGRLDLLSEHFPFHLRDHRLQSGVKGPAVGAGMLQFGVEAVRSVGVSHQERRDTDGLLLNVCVVLLTLVRRSRNAVVESVMMVQSGVWRRGGYGSALLAGHPCAAAAAAASTEIDDLMSALGIKCFFKKQPLHWFLVIYYLCMNLFL